jgi:hypothetical protein
LVEVGSESDSLGGFLQSFSVAGRTSSEKSELVLDMTTQLVKDMRVTY